MGKVLNINKALLKIGINPIVSPTQPDPQAGLMDLLYQDTLDELLCAHPWSFATCHTSLPRLSEAVLGYSYSYAVPADCIRVLDVRVDCKSPPIMFSIVGSVICTDRKPPLILRYIKRVDDSIPIPADFVAAFTTLLAAKGAPILAQNAELGSYLLGVYRQELALATLNDATTDYGIELDEEEHSFLLNARM